MLIDQLAFFTRDLGSNVASNVPFVRDTQKYYMHVGAGMFKDSSLMGIFPLPPPPPTTNTTPINMTSSFYTSGSLESFDPWVVPHLDNVESYRAHVTLLAIEIVNLTISSVSIDIVQPLHPHME
jgi:hypothetical protein